MKTITELKGTLNMILARLESEPKTSTEWEIILKALSAAMRYAKMRQLQAAKGS